MDAERLAAIREHYYESRSNTLTLARHDVGDLCDHIDALQAENERLRRYPDLQDEAVEDAFRERVIARQKWSSAVSAQDRGVVTANQRFAWNEALRWWTEEHGRH